LFDERVTLNGIDYILRFDWHQREERWYLDIQDASGNVITAGIKLVSSWLLYSRETLPQAPQGNFGIVDPDSLPPQLADFGLRSFLLFWPAA
jgi:hypothetical protein